MNNEDMKLQINPEFENMIPELTDDELSQLEENILAEGRIVNPIVVWNGVIVDGHNRYKIAQKHPHIQFTVHEKDSQVRHRMPVSDKRQPLGRQLLPKTARRQAKEIQRLRRNERAVRSQARRNDRRKESGDY